MKSERNFRVSSCLLPTKECKCGLKASQWQTQDTKLTTQPLNFTSLINSFKYGKFIQLLPLAFKKTNKCKKSLGVSKDAEERPNQKNKTDHAKTVTNTSPFPEFKLLQGETWISNFAGKREGCVKWDNKFVMCNRWFITGRYFDNCFNIASHVKKEDAPKDKLKEFAYHMKTFHGKWLIWPGPSGVRTPPKPPEYNHQYPLLLTIIGKF